MNKHKLHVAILCILITMLALAIPNCTSEIKIEESKCKSGFCPIQKPVDVNVVYEKEM